MITIDNLEALRHTYQTNEPYPHVVIDNFLPERVARKLTGAFPIMDDMSKVFREPMSYKGQTSDILGKAPRFVPIFDELQSDEFREQVGRLTGIEKLCPDALLAGGGLHQSPNSGFLDLHVDANFHPIDKSLHRRVNILIYLNPDWNIEWGGKLQLWSDRDKKPDRVVHEIAPLFNRAVIFNTTRTSWHGVTPISCPHGYSRKSIALYYYTRARPEAEVYVDSSVIWHNRSIWWKQTLYPMMNTMIAMLKPYAKYLRRKSYFDAIDK